ncbi:hypothetical protein SAMN02927924_00229 [Sphingobium faniae]|nr:hypothetical protein SAMN02927924_00229 [Sphingobium faniae]
MANTDLRADSALVTLPNCLPSMPAVARILSRYDRERLEGFVAIAIDLMDLMDGDPDLEDGDADEDDDPAGGNVEDERQMAAGQDYYRLPPRYGIDQTKGPINEIEAYRQHRRDMGCLD